MFIIPSNFTCCHGVDRELSSEELAEIFCTEFKKFFIDKSPSVFCKGSSIKVVFDLSVFIPDKLK